MMNLKSTTTRIACLSALLSLSASAFAQDTSARLNRFVAGETPEDDWGVSRPSDFGHVRFGVQLMVDYSNDPLVWESDLGMAGSESAQIVSDQLDANLGLSLGLFDRLVIFAGLPLTLIMDGATGDEVPAPVRGIEPDGFGLEDIYLGARLRLFGESDDAFAMALQVRGTFPTAGSEQRFRGDEFLSIHPELLMEVRGGPVRFALNVGGLVRTNTEPTGASNLAFQDDFTYGANLGVVVFRGEDPRTHLDITAQGFGTTAFQNFFARENTAFEINGGLKFFHSSGLTLGAAAGPGLTRGFGSPDFRIIGMLAWMVPEDLGPVDDSDMCPDEDEDMDDFQDEDGCPDPDNDQDGILDVDDRCPMRPENFNGVEDEDGCPDGDAPVDSDGDGLMDDVDQCPNEPEDADMFEDENGCPDPDNDHDEVLDVNDQCPNDPEDRDGFEDENGCPDPDNDGDSVPDNVDNCPNEPGSPRNQGCRQRQQVRITGDTIEILDKVYFRTSSDEIQRRSFALLENVATVLNNHGEIRRVRVEGHTDARGSHDSNMDLSQRRAESVVNWLVNRGNVDRARLEARGFGPDRPIVPNASSRQEHAQNRRVEFHIVGGAEGIEQGSSNAAEQGTID